MDYYIWIALKGGKYMSLASDLIILFSEKMVGRDHPSLTRTMEKLAFALTNSGLATNIINNGSFESFSLGTSNQAPDGFAKIGTPTDVSQDTGERDGFGGGNAVKITSNGAGNEGITVTLSNLKASTEYALTIKAKATAGDTARIWTTGASSNLDQNTTSTAFVDVEGTFTTDATPTNVVLNMGSNTATDIVWFDKLMIQEGEVPAIFNQHPNDEHLKAIAYQDATPTDFDFGLLRMEIGTVNQSSGGSPGAVVTKGVTFGTAFSKILTLYTTITPIGSNKETSGMGAQSASGFTFAWRHGDGTNLTASQTLVGFWLAIGVK
jgi:hypothetical protein